MPRGPWRLFTDGSRTTDGRLATDGGRTTDGRLATDGGRTTDGRLATDERRTTPQPDTTPRPGPHRARAPNDPAQPG